MEKKSEQARQRAFCETYLRTLDPARAAAACGLPDGFSYLAGKGVQQRLERMRETWAGVRREDVLRRLTQLAFGSVADAVELALHPGETVPAGLDLSAVAEFKVTDKGGVEIRFVDRLRALEALTGLLERDQGGARALYEALAEAAEEEGSWEHD